jgi:hypothetical protein
LSFTSLISWWIESAIEFIKTAVGVTIRARPSTTTTAEASPCRPPILRAIIWCSGNRVTARISAQIIRVRNGAKTR